MEKMSLHYYRKKGDLIKYIVNVIGLEDASVTQPINFI